MHFVNLEVFCESQIRLRDNDRWPLFSSPLHPKECRFIFSELSISHKRKTFLGLNLKYQFSNHFYESVVESILLSSRNPLNLARNRIKKQETDSCLTTYPSRKRQNGMGSMGVGEWRSDHRIAG